MTIEELLALGNRDRDAAWEPLRSALLRGSLWACREAGIDPAEAEDIAQDGLLRAARNDFAALRDAGGRVLLSSWARGMARNLVHEKRRAARGVLRLGDEPPGRPEPQAKTPADGWETLDLSCLTDKEAAAVRERIDGRSEREAARRLGIGRTSFRERVERAVKRLKRAHGTLPLLPEMSRGWAEELLDRMPRWVRLKDRKCLRLYTEGRPRSEIARELGTTVDGVHGLLGRFKRRFREGPA